MKFTANMRLMTRKKSSHPRPSFHSLTFISKDWLRSLSCIQEMELEPPSPVWEESGSIRQPEEQQEYFEETAIEPNDDEQDQSVHINKSMSSRYCDIGEEEPEEGEGLHEECDAKTDKSQHGNLARTEVDDLLGFGSFRDDVVGLDQLIKEEEDHHHDEGEDVPMGGNPLVGGKVDELEREKDGEKPGGGEGDDELEDEDAEEDRQALEDRWSERLSRIHQPQHASTDINTAAMTGLVGGGGGGGIVGGGKDNGTGSMEDDLIHARREMIANLANRYYPGCGYGDDERFSAAFSQSHMTMFTASMRESRSMRRLTPTMGLGDKGGDDDGTGESFLLSLHESDQQLRERQQEEDDILHLIDSNECERLCNSSQHFRKKHEKFLQWLTIVKDGDVYYAKKFLDDVLESSTAAVIYSSNKRKSTAGATAASKGGENIQMELSEDVKAAMIEELINIFVS